MKTKRSSASVRRDVLAALALSEKLTEKLMDASTTVQNEASRDLAEALKAIRMIKTISHRALDYSPGPSDRNKLQQIHGIAEKFIERLDKED